MKFQVTFFNEENKYKPVAAIIEADTRTEVINGKWKTARAKVCIKRGWTIKEMTQDYGYSIWKYRKAE